jgi:hypothetical protein
MKHSQQMLFTNRKVDGFTLASALVSRVVVGIGFSALGTLMNSSSKMERTVAGAGEFNSLLSAIKLVLANPNTCKDAFGVSAVVSIPQPTQQGSGQTGDGSFVPAVFSIGFSPGSGGGQAVQAGIYLGQSPLAYVGQDIGAGLKITRLAFTSQNQTALPGGLTRHMLKLDIAAQSNTQRLGAQVLEPKVSILVDAVANPAGQIVSCGDQSTVPASQGTVPANSGPRSCPAGMTAVGALGNQFCISTNKIPALPYIEALNHCASEGLQVCSPNQGFLACRSQELGHTKELTDISSPTNFEMTNAGNYGFSVIGYGGRSSGATIYGDGYNMPNTNCLTLGYQVSSATGRPFRCCSQ